MANEFDFLEEKRIKSLWQKLEKEKPSNFYMRIRKRKGTIIIKEKKEKEPFTIRGKEVKKFRVFRTTLDIDNTNKDFIKHICEKINSCEYSLTIKVYESSFKGYHIIIFCSKKCEICRFVYDDFRRFAYDSNRPQHARNILFQEKEVIKLGEKNGFV